VRAGPPAELETRALIRHLADGWGFDAETAEYAAVGGGSYHWVVTDRTGTRRFVTGDDLETKPWLGGTRDSVFDGLRRAFDTAAALRDAGLPFVVGPIPTSSGETVVRIGSRYTVALFPFVAGHAGTYGAYDDATRAAVVSILAELHRATSAVATVARRIELDLPGRSRLEVALAALDEPWSGGPFSERARDALTCHASDVAEWLALFDRLATDVAGRGGDWVVTHGEPHAANVLSTGDGHRLVDWDTVALAPPERDLWILVGDSSDEEAVHYAAATGHQLDQAALDFFRLMWDLEDIAAFTALLRSPHAEHADTAKAYAGLTLLLGGR
jgi:aminoglycoside phosphotransferase (APT) family kinase protein